MQTITFHPRYALRRVSNPDMEWLKDVILHPFEPGREFGEASITFSEGAHKGDMILIADRKLGYYLIIGHHEWLSLGDRSRLSEVVCPDDWKASAGLFVAPDKAWLAVQEFCKSACRTDQIDWITPDEIPDDGNY